jgi:hypothetical protein
VEIDWVSNQSHATSTWCRVDGAATAAIALSKNARISSTQVHHTRLVCRARSLERGGLEDLAFGPEAIVFGVTGVTEMSSENSENSI